MVPEIGQIFCLGDGLSGFNEPQFVLIPDAATRLFLGFIDGLKTQTLETEVHHLGDQVTTSGLFSLDPNPEGSTWTSAAFGTPSTTPTSARVLVDLVSTNFTTNELRVNGQAAALLPATGGGDTVWVTDQALSFDPTLLQANGNTIQLVAAASGSNLDDYLFRNVRLELELADASQSIETSVHHLGDQVLSEGLFSLDPNPEGSSWTSSTFAMSGASQALHATLTLDLVQTNFSTNELHVNGQFAGNLPVTGDGTAVWSNGQSVSIDPVLLQETGNLISIVAAASGSNLDDFLFRNVTMTLEFSQGPPGGYGDNTGMHEFVIDVAP